MADIWDKIGVKPYEADPSKARLPLGEQKSKSQQSSPSKSPLDGTVFAGDGTLSNALRSMGETGLNYMNTAVAGANLIPGLDIDNSLLMRSIAEIHTKQDQSDARTLSPMRKAETDKIKNELAKADGIVDNVIAGGKMGWDVMRHPIENAGQIIGGIADPMNFIPGVAGAKVAAKLGGGVLARATSGAVAGAVSNAPVNAIEEGTFAAARGEDWRKSAASGFGGGLVGGAILGGVGGTVSRPRFASDNILSKVDQHIGTHEVNHASLMDNALMQTPDGEKFDPAADVGFTREAPSVTDHPADTLPDVDHHALYGQVMGEHLDSARAEGEAVYSQAFAMAQDPKVKPEHIKAFVDNAITPTHDDLTISDLVNDGDPLPSRFSGMRLIDVLERNIKNAIENPTDAKTNIDLSNALKKEGMSKELNNVFTKAYSAKDPTILTDYIMAKTQPIADDIRAQIDEHLSGYKAQSDSVKAQRWSDAVPESAQDLVSHPKFAEHLNERADVSASDARYAQVRTADLALSHENNGQGYETVVQQPAQFDRNYNYDFEMTKKDVADIKAGRWNDELVQKLRNDLERHDNDPLYNPETPSMRLHREMSDTVGSDQADMNMALVEGRAKAMGITPDELIDRSGLSIENMRDMDGAQYVNDLKDLSFQKDPVNREKRGIYNVQFNGKNSTKVMKDMMDVEQALRFEQGFENPVLKKGYGALHIEKHIGSDKDGWVSKEELLNIGEAVRNVEPYLKDGKRVYEYHNDAGDRFRLIVGDRDSGENVISFYSNRKAGKGNNTLTYVYPSRSENKSLHQKIPDVKLTDDQINGMAELGIAEGDMKSVIYLFKTADASTLPHELMHVFERTLSDVERSAVDDVLKDYAPGTPRKEALARYFEKYLADGEAPTPELKGVFDKFRDWLTSLWENIIHDGSRDFKLTNAHREFYRALLGDREAAAKLSERYDGIVNEQIRAEAEVLFQRSEQTTERLKYIGGRWDDMIDTVFDKTGRALRGVDGDGNLKINPKSSNLLINAGQSIAEWARENVITNGSRTDAYLGVMDQFSQERGYLESEASAFYKKLKEFDDVAISDPMHQGEMTSHGALLVRALGGDMEPSSLPSSLKPHYDSFRRIIDANAKALIDAGELAPEHAMENYLKRFYQQHIDPDRPLSVGKQVMDGKHARADIDFDARRELGQVEDAAYVITRTILDQRMQLTKSMMFQRLADRVSTDAPRDGFVKVPSSKASDGKTPIYGALAGRYVDRGTLKDLQGMYDFGSALDLIVRGMSPAVDYVKVNMTVKNPGTHVYNVVSNMTIAALDGHMSEVAQVINMAVNDKPKFEKLVKMANKMGMNSMLADMEADLAQKLGKGTHPITKIVKNLWAAEGTKVGDKVRAAYDWEDKAFKLAKFYHELKKNNMRIDDASLKSAWDKVNEVYVDHTTRLPTAIRNMDKSGIYPFMGYAWRSAPQVAKLVAKHPLKVAMLQTLMGSFGWSQIALMNQMFGYDDEKDPDAPGYTEGGLNMYGIKNYVKIGDDGKVAEYLNIGRAVPGMRFIPDKGNPYLLYMDGGFLLSILGATAGVSTHGKIYEEYDSNAMKAAKAASKISEYIVPPIAPFVVPVSSGDALTATGGVKENSDGSAKTETVSVGARYAQKLIQAANGSVDRYSQPIEVSDVLAQAVGAKTLKVDKVMERSSKLKDLMQELKRAISADDSDRVEELAAEIRNLDLPDTKLTKPKDDEKKSEDKARKKKVDDKLKQLGLASKKQSSSITLPAFKSTMPTLPLGGN